MNRYFPHEILLVSGASLLLALQLAHAAPARLNAIDPPAADGFALTVTGGVGATYRLQGTAELASTAWVDLLSFSLAGTTTNIADTAATNHAKRFYRLITEQTCADPSRLPLADRRPPLFQQYPGRTLAAGQSYTDPATGSRVTKITDPSTPKTNTSGTHHYASGPVQISREWNGGFHTLNIVAAGSDYLVDYRRGGTLSNWRVASFTGSDLSFGFSFNPATPRIAYYVRDLVLHRYDTERMSPANHGNFPKNFAALENDYLLWLQYDRNDEWFVMMMQKNARIIAWNSRTDETLTLPVQGLDEPHLERDGRYVFIARDSDWLVWDLQAHVTRGPYATPFRGHPGAFRSLFAASDGNDNPAILWRHDPQTQINATLYTGEQAGNGGQHRGDQWVMTDAELGGDLTKQWLVQTVHDEGEANAGAWTLHGGQIHSAPVADWGSTYGKPAIGIRAVRQYVAGDNTRFAASLAQVASVGALTEGTFYYDSTNTRVYAWLVGGGIPTGRVEIKAPALVHDAVALLRLDGTEARLVAHHYSLNAEPQYPAMPKATISPDGKIIIFSSNMNDSDGRVDVFAVEVPVTDASPQPVTAPPKK